MTDRYKNFEVGISRLRDKEGKPKLSADLCEGVADSLRNVQLDADALEPLVHSRLPREEEQLVSQGHLSERERQERLGKRLYRAIFHAPAEQLLEDILPGDTLHVRLAVAREVVRREGGCGLRLIFRTSENAVPNLPVELLCCSSGGGGTGDFLVVDHNTPIARAPMPLGGFGQVKINVPLRILVVLCRTMLSADFKPDEVRESLEEQFRKLKALGVRLEVDYVVGTPDDPKATWDVVRKRLDGSDVPPTQVGLPGYYSIFHFIGHGMFDTGRHPPEGSIILNSDDGKDRPVDGDRLEKAIKTANPRVKLVILQSCETATTSLDDFNGVAQKLMQKAVPCVIAMQYQITADAAAKFMGLTYEHWLHKRQPLEAAVTSARSQLYEDYLAGKGQHPTDWVAPVLFLRSEIAVQWRTPELPAAKRKEADGLLRKIEDYRNNLDETNKRLALDLKQEARDELRILKKLLERQLAEAEAELAEVLGTYLDLGRAVAAPGEEEARVPVRLPVCRHSPTRVAFVVQFDSTQVKYNRVEGRAGNEAGAQKRAENRVRISIGGQDGGAIQREEEEIATLVFDLKPDGEGTKLSLDKVSIYEGQTSVSKESSPGLIVIS